MLNNIRRFVGEPDGDGAADGASVGASCLDFFCELFFELSIAPLVLYIIFTAYSFYTLLYYGIEMTW